MILLLYRISLEAEVFGVNGVYNYTISLAKYCGLFMSVGSFTTRESERAVDSSSSYKFE